MSPFFFWLQLPPGTCTGQVDQSSRHRTGDRGWIEGGELRLGKQCLVAMDQYLLIAFWVGWTSINPSYFDVNYRGTRFWHTAIYIFFDMVSGFWAEIFCWTVSFFWNDAFSTENEEILRLENGDAKNLPAGAGWDPPNRKVKAAIVQ